jgi:streptolysin S family bacteriocin protoxin
MNLVKHPPERRRRSVTLAAHGCCCCCCCCLHSLGGLIGSGIAGAKASTDEARRTVKVYWLIFLASVVIGFVGIVVQNYRPGSREGPIVALILTALGLPLAQLNASFLTLCAGMVWALDKPTLGRITWKGLLWAIVGALIMIVPAMLWGYIF